MCLTIRPDAVGSVATQQEVLHLLSGAEVGTLVFPRRQKEVSDCSARSSLLGAGRRDRRLAPSRRHLWLSNHLLSGSSRAKCDESRDPPGQAPRVGKHMNAT